MKENELLVAVATSDYFLRFYVFNVVNIDGEVKEKCSVKVGDDWITSLNFSKNKFTESVDLAISNNDKRLRVMRIFKNNEAENVSRKVATA